MRGARLAILAALVVALGAFILLYERHQPTTDEIHQQVDRIFPGLEQEAVSALEISNAHGRIHLLRQGDDWRLVEPVDSAADSSKVEGLLAALVNLEAERSLSTDEVDAAAYGLEDPPIEVVLIDHDGMRRALGVGSETALGSNRAVRTGPSDIALCAGWFAEDLEHDADHWRSREVIDIFAADVASIELQSASGRVHAVRVDDRWTLLEPVHDLADRDKLQLLISDLNAQRVEEFVDDPVDPSSLGLDQPTHRITVVRSDGQRPLVLELGSTRQQNGVTLVACRRDGSDLMWISDRALTSLGRAPVLWRSRVVFPFDSWRVEELSISADGESLHLHKQGGLWQDDDDHQVDSSAVLDRIAELSRLEAVDFDLIAPGSGERGQVEILLSDTAANGEPEPVRLTFYRPVTDGGLAVVEVSARDTVMSVDPEVAASILDIAALRGSEAANDIGDG